jgi:hypothetical protein
MKKNLGELFHWSKDYSPDVYQLLIAIIGMTFLISLGIITRHPTTGVLASFGGLTLSGVRNFQKLRIYIRDLTFNMTAGMIGFLVGNFITPHSLYSLFIFPCILLSIATIGGINRTLAKTTAIFLLFWIIATNFNSSNVNVLRQIIILLFGNIVFIIIAVIFWPVHKLTSNNNQVHEVRKYTPSQLITHWQNTLKNIKGWQYGLRLAICSFFAILVILIFPFQHSSWILLTIVIVLQRNVEHLPKRMIQRSIGTLAGVAILGVFASFYFGLWITVLLIAVLIGARILLKEGNYLFYSIVMTALVIILVDFGHTISDQVIFERVIATLTGCSISYFFGYIIWLKTLKYLKIY